MLVFWNFKFIDIFLVNWFVLGFVCSMGFYDTFFWLGAYCGFIVVLLAAVSNVLTKVRTEFVFIVKRPPALTEGVGLRMRNMIYNISMEKTDGFYDRASEVGGVLAMMDGIVLVAGMDKVKVGELVIIGDLGAVGTVLNLEYSFCRVLLAGGDTLVKTGDAVVGRKGLFRIGVNQECLGHVFDPLGNILDGDPTIYADFNPSSIDAKAPGILDRQPIYESLETGILAVDSMIPIGHGQRELIIGDRQTGKTSLALDAVVNQGRTSFRNVLGLSPICVYVSVGNKLAESGYLFSSLRRNDALKYSLIVAAGASDSANLQFLAPYVGTAMGEWFMKKGYPVLIVYDDLTKHATAYRQLSLLLRRPPGREAFPGDVFYLHARLLERSAKLSESKHRGGSLTALPIVETQAGDVSAYIPTNVISITDGQIYLEADLFSKGIMPAVNFGLSVSRVGSAAQSKAMKSVSGNLKLDFAQYREASKFAAFAADLDETTLAILHRGVCLTILLKQRIFDLVDIKAQIILIVAGVQGHLDLVPTYEVEKFKRAIMRSVNINKAWLDHFKLSEPVSGRTLNFFIDLNIKNHTTLGASPEWRDSVDWKYNSIL